MQDHKVYRAIGLMSGTSLDGIDVALIETDGRTRVQPLAFETYPYTPADRQILRAALGHKERDQAVALAEAVVTNRHIDAVRDFTARHAEKIDLIGFHGQTIFHDPANHFTWQIGDAQHLARETGIDVVADMRQADIRAGGQGAPLLPLYHRALAADLKKPVVILNIGGVSNVTWIGRGEEDLLAFDCGPGNALMDDFVKARTGADFDAGGDLAARGVSHSRIIESFLEDNFFMAIPPKSLDRDRWSMDLVRDLSLEDGLATLLALTTRSIEKAFASFPEKPESVYVAGGGRRNAFLLSVLKEQLPVASGGSVESVDILGWDGDGLEAQGFAYLAVRSVLGLPLTLPGTTGVSAPFTGGVVYRRVV